ncbi:hypothetical protein K2173_021022 [Erythroxylum novogranatense]|uniref:F-box domain-containing protein n=1 Tax=Erythroxylum novogranatense TaxID=1862640 RepID=A0AAV8TMA9_9ROSI|nr:hypothetical protein K2173_021022 [Erythroxylum novogranatense]
MGSTFSSNLSVSKEDFDASQSQTYKRHKTLLTCEGNSRLIPCLPDELSLQILARVPRICYLKLKLVSRSWKQALVSSQLFKVRKELRTTEEWLYILTKGQDNQLFLYALDPLSGRWQRLPKLPGGAFEDEPQKGFGGLGMWNLVGSNSRISCAMRGWLGKKDAFDPIPFSGCALGAINGCLYVLGGFSKSSAISRVWQYDTILNSWTELTPMSTGRAFSKIAILNDKLYVVGGITRGRGAVTTLQSAEVFDPHTGLWSQMKSMPCSKAQLLPTASLADLFKPIASGVTSYRGKLFVAQSLYCWPFCIDIGGEVYDPELNSWIEMPVGFSEGWPSKKPGTKLSALVNGELYVLDAFSSNDTDRIKVYDSQEDTWKVVVGSTPVHEFADSEASYLIVGILGKLCLITKDDNCKIKVLQAEIESPSSSSSGNRFHEHFWTVVATKNTMSTELVSCQTLEI